MEENPDIKDDEVVVFKPDMTMDKIDSPMQDVQIANIVPMMEEQAIKTVEQIAEQLLAEADQPMEEDSIYSEPCLTEASSQQDVSRFQYYKTFFFVTLSGPK
jgi:hypothetical protein